MLGHVAIGTFGDCVALAARTLEAVFAPVLSTEVDTLLATRP
jgi:hypothetical protein